MNLNNSLTKRGQASVAMEETPEHSAPVGAVGLMAVEKEAKQMEIAMITAKRFPRDYTSVEMKVERNCQRERLALSAIYSFPRGGETISGPSVKLMEVVAQCYGNIEYGVNEIQRYDGYSEAESFAWDFENNIKVARKFTVPHFRDTKQGRKRVTEDRDIREVVFNYGSRNMRACLERVIPRDLVDLAMEVCKKTLNANGKTLAERIEKCKEFFKEYEIDAILLERIIGEKLSNWNVGHLNKAISYYTALRDEQTTKQDLINNLVKTIGKNEIDELTSLIGTDQAKINALKEFGYDLGDIKNIPAVEFEGIKAVIQTTKTTKTSKKTESSSESTSNSLLDGIVPSEAE